MNNIDGKQGLKDAYTLIGDLFCSPSETDAEREQTKRDAQRVAEGLKNLDQESSMLLSSFLQEETISEEDYIDLFELQPKCSLYLGSHTYDEPSTCANAAISDRNGYMIELVGIYKHFGQVIDGKELPDYLPLVMDFLSLTVESKDDPIRGKFITEYVVPFLPPIRSRLQELETPYLHLLEALEKIIDVDLKTLPMATPLKQ